MKGKLYKIKKGKVDTWNKWGELLMTTYKDEAVRTLKIEGILAEFFYTFKIGEEWYTLGGDIEEEAKEHTDSNLEVDRLHREKKKECLEFIGTVSPTYLLKRTDL